MLERLDDIARRTDDENPVIGTRNLRELRQLRRDMPPEIPIDQQIGLLGALSEQEMWQGNSDAALQALTDAARRLAAATSTPPHLRRLLEERLWWSLAVTWMRRAEDAHCVERHTSESCIAPIRPGGQHVDKAPARTAIGYLTRLVERIPPGEPMHTASRWLLNVAQMTVGGYPDAIPPALRVDFAGDAPFPRFPEIAADAGVDAFDLCGGAAAADFDNDGLLDLVATTWDPRGNMRLWRNSGDGRFEERTAEAGLGGQRGGLNLRIADYDGDGDVDLLVLRGAWLGASGRHPNSLLQNQGDGRFVDVTFDAGLASPAYPTATAAWADYDLDGDLDLYVGNEAPADRTGRPLPHPGQLFRNRGDGTFEDVAHAARVTNDRWAKGVAWGDFDDDGDPDLYVSNLNDRNRLYRNRGDGTFEDVAPALGVTGPRDSFPTWFWDYDNDGTLDLLVNSYQRPSGSGPPDIWYVAASHLGLPNPADVPRLYRGDGRGGFTDVAGRAGIARSTLPMGAGFGDLDADGWLDFYLGTGYPGYEGLMPNKMYRNVAGERFADVTTPGGFGHLQKGHGVVFADLDNDGDQDIYQQVGGFTRGDRFVNALWRNPGPPNGHRWVSFELRGRAANRAGVGARLTVTTVGTDGNLRRIVRHVGAQPSFGNNPPRQYVGLGPGSGPVTVEVRWPGAPKTQRLEGVVPERFYRIDQTEGLVPLERRRVRLGR